MEGQFFIEYCNSFSLKDHRVWGNNSLTGLMVPDRMFIGSAGGRRIFLYKCNTRNPSDSCVCEIQKNCSFQWYTVQFNGDMTEYLVHPDSFPIIEKLIDQTPKPTLQETLSDALAFHPLFGSVVAETKLTTKIGKKE